MSFDPWTLGFQAVNVLVLVWLLQRFFWKPVAGMIADRQAKAAALLDDAATRRAEADAAMADIAATRAGLTAERDALLAAARTKAQAAHDALMATAQAEADALHNTAKAARVRAAETLKANAIADARGVALTIAERLLSRLDGTTADAAFLGWLVSGLADLSDRDRAGLAGATLTVVSATAQDSAAQDRIAGAIAQALGAPAALDFATDPALIAGYELRSPHFALRNSWRADLDRIAAALAEPEARPDAA
jgi:F-type H+-transporting ATPase subunit b